MLLQPGQRRAELRGSPICKGATHTLFITGSVVPAKHELCLRHGPYHQQKPKSNRALVSVALCPIVPQPALLTLRRF